MPSLVTHYLCGERLIKKIEGEKEKSIIEKNREAYNLGTQGPDIFFFHSIIPSRFYRIGELMHHERIGQLFFYALKYISQQPDDIKGLLFAYISGFACHYALDCSTHPYIYYRSGFRRKGEPETYKYSFYHHRFEKAIDILMLQQEHGVTPCDIEVHKLIYIQKNAMLTIGSMLESVLKDVYEVDVSKLDIVRSAFNMSRAYRHLRDKNGIKMKFFSKFKDHFVPAVLITNYLYPRKLPGNLDYLNLRHSAWCLPWDDRVVSTASFNNMFDHAVIEASGFLQSIYSCLYDGIDIKTAADKIGNRSFSTGMDCNLNLEFKYYKCIYE